VEPLVSVVIPTYNRANEIGPTLESIIAQTYSHWEAIIVDDGSTDNTAEVIKQFIAKDARIHFIQHERNRGGQAARNTGIRAATGEWIAFLDSDDRWLPESLSLRLAVAERENVLVVHSAGYLQKEGEELQQYYIPTWSGRIYHKVLTREGPMFQALLVKKEALKKIGYLDENIRAFQEWDTSIRLAKHYEFGFEPQPTFVYDLRSSDAISRDLIRGGMGYEQNIVKHRWEIIRHVGIGALSTHYDIAALWYSNGKDFKNARRCTLLALICKSLSIRRVTRKILHLTSRLAYVWSVVKLLPGYLIDSFSQLLRSLPENEKKIIFTLDDDNMFGYENNEGREAYYLLKAFRDGGYNIYFYHQTDFKSYYRLRVFGRPIYSINNLKFISKLPADTQNYIYGFDTLRPELLQLPWKRLVYVNIRKATTFQAGNVIPMPFYMLPLIYATGEDKKLSQYRELKRKYRVFFAGNLKPEVYDYHVIKQNYKQVTRLEAVNAILGSNLEVSFIKEKKAFNKILNTREYLNRLLIVETVYPFKINPGQWLQIVGQSDFFMCLSGAGYPMCHNSVEAMAVGSIPIIAYQDWFYPPLEHGKNAIIYSGKEDLIKKIEFALHMPQAEILKLRKGVIEYYESYLANGCLAAKYEENSQEISTLMLFPLLDATDIEKVSGREFNRKITNLISIKQNATAPLKISVIIPTYNRSDYLQNTIECLLKQDFPADQFEIIVADNSPNARFRQMIESMNNDKVKYIWEPRPGAHQARNSGALAARGEIVVLIDDDELFNQELLQNIYNGFADPAVGCVGGKMLPQWEVEKLPEHYSSFAPCDITHLDLGDEPRILKGWEEVWGGNMAVRRDLYIKVGGMNPDLFPDKMIWRTGDGECGLQQKIKDAGYKIFYEPKASVYNRINAGRLTEEFLFKRRKYRAISMSFANIRLLKNKRFLLLRLLRHAARCYVNALIDIFSGKFASSLDRKIESFSWYIEGQHHMWAFVSKKYRNYILQDSYL
jgi:glycosyltransferase involved in cell wall biosynthesis